MSDELEAAAIDGIALGDLQPLAKLLCYHGGPAFNMLAMLITGGHLKFTLKGRKKTEFEYMKIGAYISSQSLRINSDGTVEKASLEAAISEAKREFKIGDSTAWRAWRKWNELTSGPFPRHIYERLNP